jgi:CelD/BcsL family acetyltransferase involved in cellulose biosynthesis
VSAAVERLALDETRWRRFVDSRADATPFHDPAWAALIAECYGLEGHVLALLGEGGAIEGGIPLLAPPRLPGKPRRLVSLPFTDSLEPLVDPGAEHVIAASLEAARLELGLGGIDLRGYLPGATALASDAFVHVLALSPDPDELLLGMGKTRRRNIRSADAAGFDVRRGMEERDLTDTYFRLHLATRRRLGVPAQPARFFRLLWRRIIEPGGGFVLLAYRGSRPVAGAVFLTSPRTAVYKFSASDGDRRSQGPTEILLWTAIAEVAAQGLERFDLGRSDASASGLRAFKSSWGAHEEPLVYSTVGGAHDRGTPTTPGLASTVLRRAPTWVTRATGELLYRFAA